MAISGQVIGFAVIVVVALLFFSIGYLLALRRQGRENAELAVQLRRAEECQDELGHLRNRLHAAELSVNTAQTRLSGAHDTLKRLDDELERRTATLAETQASLDRLRDSNHHTERKMEAVLVENRSLTEALGDSREKLSDYARRYDQLAQDHVLLKNEHVEIRTTLEKKEEHFREQMQQLGDARQSLLKEFENLANRIFEEKGKIFADTSQLSVANMLKPFREQIEGFQKRINEVHDASLQGNASLNVEIRKVLDIGLQMSKEANSLASALKGDSQQRGAWGEAQLRRTLEMSGLMEEAHYEVQSSFRDAEGRQKQTDYLVKLPDGKHIIIDSKVSLNAYDRAISAESQADHQLAMNEHVRAVRRHIDDLASKDYTNLIGIRSPSFVLMFMPIEPAYIDALKANRDLFEYGYRKGIVLVSHTTLIPILRTVSNLWMIERSNAEAREISEKAGDIYNSVCLVAERLSRLGNTLNTASNHYNGAVTALAGQQGLYGRVDRFRQLSAKVSKNLPSLETAHMDFETERLGLIVEPVAEPVEQSSV